MKKIIDIDDLLEKEIVPEKEKRLTTTDHLEAILHQFVNLYDRWAEDRQVAAKQGADIEKFIKKFSEEVTHFENLENDIRKEIATSIHTESKNMAEYLGKIVADSARKEIKPIVNKLANSVEEAEDTLSYYKRESYHEKWMWIGATICASILSSVSVMWYLMPDPMLPLTEDQLKTYQSGQVFEMVMPKLSKRQQDLILDIARGKAKNPEKLFEDTKKKPSISNS